MKTLVILAFILLFTSNNFSQIRDDLYKSLVFGENGRTFVRVILKTPKFKEKVLITNSDLYSFLLGKKHITEKQYEEFVKKLNCCDVVLKINNKNYEKEGFYRINQYPRIDELAAKGQDAFLSYYFKDNYIDTSKVSSNEEIITIASKLLDWNIRSYFDDTSGLLAINRHL